MCKYCSNVGVNLAKQNMEISLYICNFRKYISLQNLKETNFKSYKAVVLPSLI
jgi:hypothetical protein